MPGKPKRLGDPTERTQYDLLRSRHGMIPLSILTKLRLCALLGFLGALADPIAATLPVAVQTAYFTGDPVTTRLGAAAAVLVGVVGVAAAEVGLTGVALYVDRHPDPPEELAWKLVAAEDTASMFGFVTGTLGVLSGDALLASGHWGLSGVSGLVEFGIRPYLTYEAFPATPRLAAVAGLVVCLGALASSLYVDRS